MLSFNQFLCFQIISMPCSFSPPCKKWQRNSVLCLMMRPSSPFFYCIFYCIFHACLFFLFFIFLVFVQKSFHLSPVPHLLLWRRRASFLRLEKAHLDSLLVVCSQIENGESFWKDASGRAVRDQVRRGFPLPPSYPHPPSTRPLSGSLRLSSDCFALIANW